jgi:hypothetical protein
MLKRSRVKNKENPFTIILGWTSAIDIPGTSTLFPAKYNGQTNVVNV